MNIQFPSRTPRWIRVVSSATTYVLAILILVELTFKIYTKTQSMSITILSMMSVCSCGFLPSLWRYIYRPAVFKLFQQAPSLIEHFVVLAEHVVKIDEHGKAWVNTSRKAIFFENPGIGDLFDTVFVQSSNAALDIPGTQWQSKDSDPYLTQPEQNGMLKVFWKPKKGYIIRPKSLYHHQYAWSVSGGLADPINHWVAFVLAPTGYYRLRLQTHQQIKRAVGLTLTEDQQYLLQGPAHQYYQYVCGHVSHRYTHQPELNSDGYGLKWELEDISQEYFYVCVFFHSGSDEWLRSVIP